MIQKLDEQIKNTNVSNDSLVFFFQRWILYESCVINRVGK